MNPGPNLKFAHLLIKVLQAFLLSVIAIVLAHVPATAQVVPWSRQDVGTTGATSTFTYNGGATPPTYTLAGSGNGVGTTDSFAFVSTPASGTGVEISAKVVSQQNTGAGAQAGLIMRQSFGTNVGEAEICVSPTAGVSFIYRGFNGGVTTVAGPALAAPVYLRLAKTGTTITGFSSPDGVVWTTVGSYTGSSFAPLFQCGMSTSSSVPGTLSSVVYDHLAFMTSVPQAGSANLMCWLRADVGVTSSAGKVSAWADQSGLGNSASQATGTKQPSIVTGVVNNSILPAVSFDGTNHYMTLPSDFADFTAGAHYFAVISPSSSATGDVFALGNAANSDALIARDAALKPSMFVFKTATSSNVTSGTTDLTQNQYQVFEGSFTPGPSASTGVGTLWVNGVQKATASNLVQNMNNITRGSNFLGTEVSLANKFPGGIAELLVYNAPLTSSQIASIQSYLLSKYNIGATPTLDPPALTPSTSIIYPRQTVTISQGQGAVSYYTQNGSTPSTASLWYNNQPISIPNSQTLKAIAVMPFFNNSAVSTAVYQADPLTLTIPRNGLILWLNASNAVTLTGGAVSTWGDSSGMGSDATQGTAGNRPTLVTNAINGLPAVSFNGSTQFLQVPSTNLSNFTSGASGFLLVKPVAVTANARFFDFGNGAVLDNLYMNQPASTSVALFAINGSTSSNLPATSSVTVGQFQLLDAAHNGAAAASIYANGLFKASSSTMQNLQNIARTKDFIGQSATGTNFYNGQIAEMLLYNRGVTASERSAIEAYLINRYSVLTSVAVAAPILSVPTSTLTAPAQVAIAAPAAGTTVYVTLDGTTPTTSSPVYTGPINIAWTQTLKAIAVANGVTSAVSTATYTLDSTKWVAPATSDTSTLQLNLQLPNVSIPQDSNQH